MSPRRKKFFSHLKKLAIFALLYSITIGIVFAALLLTPHPIDGFGAVRVVIIFFTSVLLAKYLFYMIMSPLHDAMTAISQAYWKHKRPRYEPRVSILIPAWNEEVGIIHTVQSLVNNTYDNMEIVVVNDGSTDNSDAMMREYVEGFNKKKFETGTRKTVVYHYQENGGKGKALNTAISFSGGEILISIDADCFVKEDGIANFVEHFRNPKVMAAVGNVRIGNTRTVIGLIQYLEFLFSFYFKKADSVMNTIYIIGGAAGAFRRSIFEEMGGYNTKNITEDIELSMRIQDKGMRVVYAHDVLVYTEGASDVRGLVKQRLRWKRGRFETFRDYMHMFLSLKKEHNKILCWVMLPLAIFAELQLILEFFFLTFLYIFSFITHDYTSFISGILVVSSMFFVQMLFDDKSTRKLSFFMLAPIAWLLFYTMTYVEANALVKSVWGFVRKQEVTWQKWTRAGVNG